MEGWPWTTSREPVIKVHEPTSIDVIKNATKQFMTTAGGWKEPQIINDQHSQTNIIVHKVTSTNWS